MKLMILYIATILVLCWSGFQPYDRFTWVLEVVPGCIGILLAFWLWKKSAITPLALTAIALHSIILFIGGKYTYARVPVGDWAKDFWDLGRNHYDRFAHIAQGFFPAIFFREMIYSRIKFSNKFWSYVVIVSMCLAFSAFYELIEFAVAQLTGEGATDFLGTQGDQWDTQWDMLMALIGAILSIILLSPMHKSQLSKKKFHGQA